MTYHSRPTINITLTKRKRTMNRTFTVVDSTTQKTSTFQSTAETLAELKADLRAHSINYNGMTIYEGISKTELKSDNSALPHDVPYKGGTTNNLVFRLTKSEKNIKSGAMSRPEAYAAVKKLGLQDAIAKKYGKNFTMCKTADLIAEVEKAQKKSAALAPKAEPKKVEKPAPKKEEKKEEAAPAQKPACKKGNEEGGCAAIKGLAILTNTLVLNGVISEAEGKEVADALNVELAGAPEGTYSQAEIAAMFDFCK